MPSERNRSKEDTWTTDELSKALKRDDGRRHRDDREQRRKDRHRDEINGEDRHKKRRDDDERHLKDDDRRSRHKDEDERERQRRERREKREGKSKTEEKKPRDEERKKRLTIDDDDDDNDGDRKRNKDREREEERERRRQKREEEDKRKQHRSNDDREKRHRDEEDRDRRRQRKDEDSERRHHRDDDGRRDRDDERRRDRDGDRRRKDEDLDRKRHRDDDERRRERREKERSRDDDDDRRRERRDRPRDDEDERERQRRERREKREGKDKDRDRDRDRDRERRKKEEEEEERRQRKQEEKEREERKSKERSSYGRNRDDDTKSSKKKEEEEEDPYADEEFEDYEEDFEDEEEEPKPSVKTSKLRSPRNYEESIHKSSRPGTVLDYSDNEMNDLLSALDKENERLLEDSRAKSSRPRNRYEDQREDDRYNQRNDDRDDSEDDQPKMSRSKTLINFMGAKKRAMTSHAGAIIGKRAQDLLQMVELDTAEYDLFDMPPVKEYDLYIRSFGRSDTTQAYVQTNDDDIDREIQTDEIDVRQKWTQHPAEDSIGCGRGDGAKDIEEEEQSHGNKQLDLGRLSKFVQKAGQVISILLDEEKDMTKADTSENKSNVGVSEGYTQLGRLSILKGRCVLYSQFSPSQPNMLITAYSKPAQEDDANSITKKGIVCVWNTDDPSYPQRILACESQPTCCCFSPNKTSLAFAGMVDGSICVWDLREQSSMHQAISYDDREHVLRYPTFNTAAVMDADNHHSPVTTLNPVSSYTIHSADSGRSEDTGKGLSFQLISCEDQGILNFWVVAEIASPDMAGSETDLGLSPGGKIKLIKSSAIVLQHPPRYKRIGASLRATEVQLAPSDPNHYYVGTDSGYILHGLRFGNRAFPSSYSTGSDAPMDITSIDFSPFGHPCFLASCSDGSVHLYNIKQEKPIMTWSSKIWDTQTLKCVKWSRSRPCVFYVLDDHARLFTFDILEGDSMPAKIDTLSSQDRIVHLQFTADTKGSTQVRFPQMLVSHESGQTEIHTVAKEYREQQTLESDFLPSYLKRF
ncbi:cytoplasmic dynein 2 intermediate chain 1-like isoform X3 [Argopecten irradians]|uniref:cytoplasmic dynein 2 intermediate chain 1-like isoform X3 n=1 Tax=Argopecten irradians TaxID=31199 RepID=UPI00371526DF